LRLFFFPYFICFSVFSVPFTLIKMHAKWHPGTRENAMPLRLTQAIVDAEVADGRDRFVFDSMISGFALRVTPAGRKIYVAQARVGGVKRRITVAYAADTTLAKARREAVHTLSAMRQGVDPSAERKARVRAAVAGGLTLRQLAEQWLANFVRPKLKPRTAFDYERILGRRILPALGTKLVGEIDHDDVEALHLAMAKTPRRANYTVSTLRSLLNYAEKKGLRARHTNPCVGIKFYRENTRERFLNEAEIGAAADAIATAEKKGIGLFAAAGLRLALFTGARSGEVTSIKWDHIDWDRRLIRLPDSKTNEPRTIHLSDAAIEVLRGVPHIGPYVVAGARKDAPFQNLSRSWIVARKFAGLDDVRLHDLRHSYASLAAGRGVSLHVIGKLLGHKVPATTQRYAHLARDIVQDINDELGQAMAAAIAKPRSEVVKLRRKRK
jgi:integrase